jgi:hypothetical protein
MFTLDAIAAGGKVDLHLLPFAEAGSDQSSYQVWFNADR